MHGGSPRTVRGLGTVLDNSAHTLKTHLVALRALLHCLDDRAGVVRTECGGSNRLDKTTRLVWQLLGPGRDPSPVGRNLPPLPSNPGMARWQEWGRDVLRQGDIVFRLGDARVLRGMVPLSRFIARATGSPFSHTGIVAIEDGSPVVYDCSSPESSASRSRSGCSTAWEPWG